MSDPPRSSIGSLGALSAVGIAFVLAVVIGFLVGYWLDRWLGTSPLFILVFFFLGVAAGHRQRRQDGERRRPGREAVRFAAEPDRAVRLFERDAAVACVAMAVVALAVGRGRPDGAAGVLAGGALTGLSVLGAEGGRRALVVSLAGRAAQAAGRKGDRGPPLPAGKRVRPRGEVLRQGTLYWPSGRTLC